MALSLLNDVPALHTQSESAQRRRSGAILTVDLDALCANYRLLRGMAGAAACGAAVKADAYGLGALPVARALYGAGCRHFFVAHLDEGLALRPHLALDAALFVLHGPMPGTEVEFSGHHLVPVLNSAAQVAGWSAHARTLGRTLPALVQVDTGMSRMGLSAAEVDAWLADPHFLDGIELLYLMSHLACADEPEHPMNGQQLARFDALRARLPACRTSLANSSGIFLGPAYHGDLVRPGAALYGIAPQHGRANPMAPVVRLQGKVLQTRELAAGSQVGYGARYISSVPCRVATVAVGYADGWLRAMSNRGLALVDGVRVPQIGTISMDSLTLDISALPPGRLVAGSLVDLICADHPVDAVAALAHTIAYEVLTSLGPRYYRQYLDPQ